MTESHDSHEPVPGDAREAAGRSCVRRATLLLVLGLVIVALPATCRTTIVPPADPLRPVTVLVLDHGHTPSLVIPSGDGRVIRYAYGEWNYYALGQRGPHNAAVALFWPTQGALGRNVLPGPPDPDTIQNRVRVVVDHVYALRVSESAVDGLRNRLEDAYRAAEATRVVNPSAELAFIHDPARYHYFHNSNHAVADWLRELDCEVQGPAVNSRWTVEYVGATSARSP